MRLSRNDIPAVFEYIRRSLVDAKDLLTGLDADIGDGDLGLTMTSGFASVCTFMAGDGAPEELSALLVRAGFVMAENVPSTMGTLTATAIMRAGKIIQGREYIDADAGRDMLRAAIEGIEVRGKAHRGEKTILDALYPALESYEAALVAGRGFPECVAAAFESADQGARATTALKSVHGKAAVFGDGSIGKQDPGAIAGALILRGVRDWFDAAGGNDQEAR